MTNNWRIWMVGMAASLAIFLVVYFTVIKPSTDTANQVLRTGLQQSQQAINQASKQLGAAGGAGSAGGAAVSTAQKLTACVAAAGTNTGKIEACQAKFTP
jgi:pectate lyase